MMECDYHKSYRKMLLK